MMITMQFSGSGKCGEADPGPSAPPWVYFSPACPPVNSYLISEPQKIHPPKEIGRVVLLRLYSGQIGLFFACVSTCRERSCRGFVQVNTLARAYLAWGASVSSESSEGSRGNYGYFCVCVWKWEE